MGFKGGCVPGGGGWGPAWRCPYSQGPSKMSGSAPCLGGSSACRRSTRAASLRLALASRSASISARGRRGIRESNSPENEGGSRQWLPFSASSASLTSTGILTADNVEIRPADLRPLLAHHRYVWNGRTAACQPLPLPQGRRGRAAAGAVGRGAPEREPRKNAERRRRSGEVRLRRGHVVSGSKRASSDVPASNFRKAD